MQRRELIKLSALLLGTAASFSVSRALLAGANAAPGAAAKVFNSTQQTAIDLLSDMIIPTTDTPGAVAAGVPDFIASIIGEWYTDTERDIFFAGLNALDKYCFKQKGQPFHQATEATRIAALQDQERLAAEYKSAIPGELLAKPAEDEHAPFFKKIKELVVLGYYSSEVGATQELAYRPVPGEYNGNYEFAKVGRQWSH